MLGPLHHALCLRAALCPQQQIGFVRLLIEPVCPVAVFQQPAHLTCLGVMCQLHNLQ